MFGFIGLLGISLLPFAQAGELKSHGILLGVGTQYGWEGIGYTHRFSELWASGIGLGSAGLSLNGRASPFEGFRPFYFLFGLSPIPIIEEINAFVYGPELGVGLETKYKAFAVNFSLGVGTVTVDILGASVTSNVGTASIGLGYNF